MSCIAYPVAVIADGAFDRHPLTHKVSLLDLHLKYATVINLSTALGAMRSPAPIKLEA
jgi:maleamate amidohydrolase